jgi:hypothetical protein
VLLCSMVHFLGFTAQETRERYEPLPLRFVNSEAFRQIDNTGRVVLYLPVVEVERLRPLYVPRKTDMHYHTYILQELKD